MLPGGVVLAGEGGGGLAERGNDIISEVFKIHGDGAACDGRLTEAVD